MDSIQEAGFGVRAGRGYERSARLLLHNRSGRPPRACFDVVFACPCLHTVLRGQSAGRTPMKGTDELQKLLYHTTALRPPKVGPTESALKVLTLVRGDAGLLE